MTGWQNFQNLGHEKWEKMAYCAIISKLILVDLGLCPGFSVECGLHPQFTEILKIILTWRDLHA
jgi:hypothetical protein